MIGIGIGIPTLTIGGGGGDATPVLEEFLQLDAGGAEFVLLDSGIGTDKIFLET